jgi:ATP citrate (pro-S)-lyase
LGLIRKPSSFISTISDDRGEELMYGSMAISDIIEEDLGINKIKNRNWWSFISFVV